MHYAEVAWRNRRKLFTQAVSSVRARGLVTRSELGQFTCTTSFEKTPCDHSRLEDFGSESSPAKVSYRL
jgi:hypothetical protein